jgi:putative peptide zinc metalloprotease protein
MLCRSCRRQLSRSDDVCNVCGTPVPGRGKLELFVGDGRRIPLLANLSLGRGTDNLIRIDGDTVSRVHAKIVLDGGRVFVEDAGSTYGTFVDGTKIAGRTALHDGAVVRLGDVELNVEAKRSEAASGKTVLFGAIPGVDDTAAAPTGLSHPRLRPGSRLKRLEAEEGDLRFVLSGPDGRFVRMNADDADMVELLDGDRTLAELIAAAGGRFGPDGPGRLAGLLADLGDRGLLVGVEEALPAAPRHRWMRALRTRQRDFAGAGPLFDRVYRAGAWVLFTLPVLAAIASVGIGGLVAFVYLIAGRDVSPFVVASRVGLGGLIFLAGRFLVVVVHEFAHGLTVASFGRKVPKAGIKLVLIFPYAYVDTSEGWFEPSRRRIAISAAGPVSDLSIGGSAALLTVFWPAGTMQDIWFQLALAAYTGAIFNLNPLLDRDGYHILVDLMREPGLRRRSKDWLAARLSGHAAEPDDAGVLATYAVTALVWSLATLGFTVAITQRYYTLLTELAPASVVWVVLIAFYVLMLLPIFGVFWKALRTRRSDRAGGVEGAVV